MFKNTYFNFATLFVCVVFSMIQTAIASESGNLNDEVYSKLIAEHNHTEIKRLLQKERMSEERPLDAAFMGIADDLKIINKNNSDRETHRMALEMLLQDRCLEHYPVGDLRNADRYFNLKKDILLFCFNFPDFFASPQNKKYLEDFLLEVKGEKIEGYRNQGTSRPGWEVLLKAGVMSRAQLTSEELIAEYDEAGRENV